MQVFKRLGRPGYYASWQAGGADFVRATGEFPAPKRSKPSTDSSPRIETTKALTHRFSDYSDCWNRPGPVRIRAGFSRAPA